MEKEQEIRVEALHVAVTIYPKEVRLSIDQHQRAMEMVFRFADRCVSYIEHGFENYDTSEINEREARRLVGLTRIGLDCTCPTIIRDAVYPDGYVKVSNSSCPEHGLDWENYVIK